MGLHLALTAAGYPVDQLYPRINIWAYAAAALPIPVTIAAYLWAAGAVRHWLGRLLMAAGLLFVVSDPVSFAGLAFATPDYYAWAYPAALVLAGWLLRTGGGFVTLTRRSATWLAVFSGACVAVKPTYLVFFVPIYCAYLLHRRSPRDIAALALTGAAGLAVGLGIIAAYYRFSPAVTLDHLVAMVAFSAGAASPTDVGQWLRAQPLWPPSAILVSFVVPVALALGAIVLPMRRFTLVLLACSMLALALASKRFYSATFVETTSVMYAIVVVWVGTVVGPLLLRRTAFRMSGYAAGSLALALLVTGTRLHYQVVMVQATWSASILTTATSTIEQFRQEYPGRTLVLIPDNNRRPLTVDSSIAKGGTDIHNRTWGVSPFVAGLFPNRRYVTAEGHRVERPTRLEDVDTLVFAVGPAPPSASIQAASGIPLEAAWRETHAWLLDLFGVRLGAWECPVSAFATNNSLVVGCYRREQALVQSERAWLVHDSLDLRSDVRLDDASGTPRPLANGDLLYVRTIGELYRYDGDDRFSRVRGSAGLDVYVGNGGSRDAAAGSLTGMRILADGGSGWKPDSGSFTVGSVPLDAATLGRDWVYSSDEQISSEWLTDDGGPFLRVYAKRADASVLLQVAPHEAVAGSPLTLRAEVRASRPKAEFWMTAYDNSPGVPQRATSRKEVLTGQWQSLTLYVPPLASPVGPHRLGGGPATMQANEYVDIRAMTVYAGLAP